MLRANYLNNVGNHSEIYINVKNDQTKYLCPSTEHVGAF